MLEHLFFCCLVGVLNSNLFEFIVLSLSLNRNREEERERKLNQTQTRPNPRKPGGPVGPFFSATQPSTAPHRPTLWPSSQRPVSLPPRRTPRPAPRSAPRSRTPAHLPAPAASADSPAPPVRTSSLLPFPAPRNRARNGRRNHRGSLSPARTPRSPAIPS